MPNITSHSLIHELVKKLNEDIEKNLFGTSFIGTDLFSFVEWSHSDLGIIQMRKDASGMWVKAEGPNGQA